MKICKGISFILAQVLLFTQACSCRGLVYEDRSGCDRYVFIDVTNADVVDGDCGVGVLCSSGDSKGSSVTYYTSVSKLQSKEFYLSVDANEPVEIYGVVNYGGCEYDSFSCWYTLNGSEFPELYRFSGHYDVTDDTNTVPVVLCKEFSRVTVSLVDFGAGACPFEIIVRSNSRGIDAKTGVPVYGQYRLYPDELEPGRFCFRIPRQLDESLVLRLRLKEGMTYRGSFKEEIAMATYLRVLSNINWDEKNVPDIDFEINCNDWTYRVTVYSFNT